jgi:hypothetical protein
LSSIIWLHGSCFQPHNFEAVVSVWRSLNGWDCAICDGSSLKPDLHIYKYKEERYSRFSPIQSIYIAMTELNECLTCVSIAMTREILKQVLCEFTHEVKYFVCMSARVTIDVVKQ